MKKIKLLDRSISIIAILMTLVQLYTYIVGSIPVMQQRTLFLSFIFLLILLLKIKKKLLENKIDMLSIFLLVTSFISCYYIFFNWYELSKRIVDPTRLDIIVGMIIIITVIQCTNIKLGIPLPLISVAFIYYALLGNKIDRQFGTACFSIQRLATYLTMETSGVFGTVLGTAAKYIFIFVIFGSFLEYSGANVFFLDITDRILGTSKGSGAKINTISSGLFGMISGSAVANVMAVGPMTIPLMRKNGFSDNFSGAVSSISGTGGQLMPPIMGTAAFIMAETISVNYRDVTMAALIPGILFYVVIWITINIHSNKLNIKSSNEKKEWITCLKNGFYYFIPILFLIITISFYKWSPIKAGIWSIVLIIIVSQLNPVRKMTLKDMLHAMENAAYNSLAVGIACATSGIIIGILSLTGLSLKFSGMLVLFSNNNLTILLILTMVSGLILGMGMTTTSVYIVLSVLVAPALINFGISPMAAHLFVFYFGILSCITPPVSTAVYAAASIAKTSPMRLAMYTTKIATPIYMIPFMFIVNPELLMLKGNMYEIIIQIIFAVLSLTSMIVALQGFYDKKLNRIERVILFICSFAFFEKRIIIKFIIFTIMLVILFFNKTKRRKKC